MKTGKYRVDIRNSKRGKIQISFWCDLFDPKRFPFNYIDVYMYKGKRLYKVESYIPKKNNLIMSTEEFKKLEELLNKMQQHLGHKFCVVPNVIHDGYYVAIYNDVGNLKMEDSWSDLEGLCNRFKEKL